MAETSHTTATAEAVSSDKLQRTRTMLTLTYGLVPIVAGLDKFANLLTNWADYLSPLVAGMLPVAPTTFMGLVGVIEIVAGIAVFVRTREAAYVVAAWLTLIALNLLVAGQFDVAVRDVVMAIGAVALAWITEATETTEAE